MNRFDLAASSWDSNSKRVQIARSAIQKILDIVPIDKNYDVLDYGCGTGLMAFGLSEVTQNVLGMDSSVGMIEEFNKKAIELGFLNTKGEFHDITDNHLPINKFDMIVSSMTLHHIPNTDDFISKCATALRKSGYICMNDLEKEDGSFHEHGNDGVYHFGFEKEKIEEIFKNNNLEIVFFDTVYTIQKSKDFPVFLIVAKKL